VQKEVNSVNDINVMAEASAALIDQLQQCRRIAGIYLERALKGNQYSFPVDEDYAMRAVPMVRLTAELASTLARLKGEVRQHIVVEHIETPAPPALVGEARAAPLSPMPEGGGADSAKRVVVDAVPHDAKS
jgi:hypothetical protein